ncbi:mammalian ependymin-related protein 1-like [Dysidea avara]|uniref:mammalian ependymin-related protein 1-like n=1 Tax=Dysidea avara TaxID=196820 RepID=UPI003320421A
MKAIVLVLFVAIVTSQAQQCTTPQQWESQIFSFYSTSESTEPTAIRRGKESYDATNFRRRFIEELDTSRTDRNYYDELYLHKEGVGYRLNLKTRECEKFPLTEPWHPTEVPENTTLDGTYYLGSTSVPNNYVEMNFYHGYTDRGYYRGSWTVRDCLPFVHSYLMTQPSPSYHRTTHLDITPGLSDPNVFVPPQECQ